MKVAGFRAHPAEDQLAVRVHARSDDRASAGAHQAHGAGVVAEQFVEMGTAESLGERRAADVASADEQHGEGRSGHGDSVRGDPRSLTVSRRERKRNGGGRRDRNGPRRKSSLLGDRDAVTARATPSRSPASSSIATASRPTPPRYHGPVSPAPHPPVDGAGSVPVFDAAAEALFCGME
jgi:hypothetical protein